VFTGEYEVWEKVYDICMKIYARKEDMRGKKGGIEIDQLLENQIEDQEFTQFLVKASPELYQLSSVLFYFKNCPISAKTNLRLVIMRKIRMMLEGCCFSELEDVVEYIES
jgi:hypothetical protein